MDPEPADQDGADARRHFLAAGVGQDGVARLGLRGAALGAIAVLLRQGGRGSAQTRAGSQC